MKVELILAEFQKLGGQIWIKEDGRLRIRVPEDRWSPKLFSELRAHKPELISLLQENAPKPYFDQHGELVIPFGCLARFRWWDDRVEGRMTIREIRTEIERHMAN
jgi:hypothetical protein